jgi:hypothetical protein
MLVNVPARLGTLKPFYELFLDILESKFSSLLINMDTNSDVIFCSVFISPSSDRFT